MLNFIFISPGGRSGRLRLFFVCITRLFLSLSLSLYLSLSLSLSLPFAVFAADAVDVDGVPIIPDGVLVASVESGKRQCSTVQWLGRVAQRRIALEFTKNL